ncbi:serine hydrolase [Bradyrhizobium sp. Leo170]|uniref:serine hydrolase n=1 Tax=Bradyrhizobium sp. Leo170 TaxID=1571199 RepID=UPI00102E39E3|nr:serine hydrolase [Bradyrhizobium sp. Leo170]TAI65448.1 serine hydrolase [Bradyrhizobium sp. Leo170]
MTWRESVAALRLTKRAVATELVAFYFLWASALTPSLAETSPPQTAGVPISAGQIDSAIVSLDALAADIMKKSGIPGMAVAVVRDGKTVYAKGFGVRKMGESQTIDADTVFQIASLSKSLAASVVAHQVGAGIVNWNTPLVTHLPWFKLMDPWVTQHVTIGDMFSHRSGLPEHAGDDLEDLGYDRRTVLERLRLLPLRGFRNVYAYTNFGLTAAAEAVAAASGKDWESLSEDVLYRPLGMTATSSRFADFKKQSNRAVGHVKVGESFQPKYQRLPDAQSPAGGVSSSANDLARWMALVLQHGTFEGGEIIPGDALLPAVTGEVISTHSSAVDARPSLYGYGFGVGITPAGRIMISHSGAFALGAGTHYAMIPSAGVGIVVLTNAEPNGAAEALGASFTDLVQFGMVTRDWFAAYTAAMAELVAPTGDLVGKSPPATPAPAAKLSSYVGTYANPYFGNAEIAEVSGHLELKIGVSDRPCVLTHWDGNVFSVSPSSENQTDGSLSSITFKQAGNGTARALTIEYLDGNGLGLFLRR